MKNWKDYFDSCGLIVGLNYSYKPEDKVQRGDSLQRAGLWYLFANELWKLGEKEYLKENFGIEGKHQIGDKFIDMYSKCFLDLEYFPLRHPQYSGPGKTSRDQMISNYWALLDCRPDFLDVEWDRLKASNFILPANDILGPEHLAIFWRYFYLKSKWLKPFWYTLMLIGDFHNVLSTLVKIFHSHQQRYHNDDPTRICMVLGASTIVPTPLGKLSAYLYWKFRPAWKPKVGSYYFRKPNNVFERDHETIGANYAMKHYCAWQEAPWDEMLKPISKYYFEKGIKCIF